MSFYTSVNRYGNTIMYRGYNDSGAPISYKEKFKPTLYVNSKKPTNLKSFDGNYVQPRPCDSMKEAKEWLDFHGEMDGFKAHGTTNYIHQFITEKFT